MSELKSPLQLVQHYQINIRQYNEEDFNSDSVLVDEFGDPISEISFDDIMKRVIEDVNFYIAQYKNLGEPSIHQISKDSAIVEWHDSDGKIIQGCEWQTYLV